MSSSDRWCTICGLDIDFDADLVPFGNTDIAHKQCVDNPSVDRQRSIITAVGKEIHSIDQSIARIEKKVDDLILIERTLKKESLRQKDGEVDLKAQLRTQRLEKDNLALRTMLAKALELLSGDDE